MNVDVISCNRIDEVDDVLPTMTERRIRHLPVILNNELRGIVSMGDLVKVRIGELKGRSRLSAVTFAQVDSRQPVTAVGIAREKRAGVSLVHVVDPRLVGAIGRASAEALVPSEGTCGPCL